ncbi:glycosyltransferase [Enterovirga sp. CN4-39]|uniref:glycosyltransferase n=1 Tax=Enterovirga sp. CN4-39 TaxID=3400910 RepID=UPI003BFB3574
MSKRGQNPHFDPDWYLATYPDVRASGVDPYRHYLRHGAVEGRDPSPAFSTSYYLERYEDVRRSGVNPLVHFWKHGEAEGRRPLPAILPDATGGDHPHLTVDRDWYLSRNHDVREAGIDPVAHYFCNGEREGRAPNPYFDPKFYLDLYGDVRASGMGALEHYARFGLAQGRLPKRGKLEPRGGKSILFVGHDGYPAGAQRVLLEIIRWFVDHTAYDIRILLLGSGDLSNEYGRLAPCFSIGKSLDEDEDAIRRFLTPQPDIIYCNTVVSGRLFQGSIRDLLKDSICFAHSHELGGVVRLFETEFRQLAAVADFWIAASPASGDYLRQSAATAGKPVRTIPAFISPSSLSAEERRALRIRERRRLDIDQDAFLVLGCGTLNIRKDPGIFLETARTLCRQLSWQKLAFLWIGDGEMRADLERAVQDLGLADRFKLLGYHSDAANLMNVGDLFFLSSQEDPFPLVVLEAAQFSIPTVAFRGATGMEGFLESGGILVEERSPAAAAAAITSLVASAERRGVLGEAARRELQREHTVAVQAPRILATMQEAGCVPAVSVVVPNYNHERFISRRLDSILEQSVKDVEVIVLDDASTDGSLAAIQPYLSDPRVRLVANGANSGSLFRQWRRGLELAKSDIVWIAESDDECDHEFLRMLLPKMSRPDVKIAFGWTDVIDENSRLVSDGVRPYLDRVWPGFGHEAFTMPGARFVNAGFGAVSAIVNASGALLRKSALLPSLEDATRYRMCGDWRIYLQALLDGTVVYEPKAVNRFRRHSQSAVHRLEGTDTYFRERLEIARYVVTHYRTTVALRRRIRFELDHEAERFAGRYDPSLRLEISAVGNRPFKPDYVDGSIHVCFYVHGLLFSKGGIERLVALLSSGLLERGYRVSIACRPQANACPIYHLRSGVEVFPVDIERQSGRNALRSHLIHEAVDVFIPMLSESLFEQALSAAEGSGCRIIASEHNNPWVIEERWWSRERRLAAFNRVDAIHLVSGRYLASLPEEQRGKAQVIGQPVDAAFVSATRRLGAARRVVGIGRLAPQKRFDLLIDAFAQVADEFPDWELDIYGEGELRAPLERRIADQSLTGRVRLPGTTTDMVSVLEQSDIFVLSSEFEGAGLALIEAMAAGVPAVGFAGCFGNEDFITDGVNGLLAAEFSATSLAQCLRRLMASQAERESLGAAAREIAGDHELGSILDRWEALIADVHLADARPLDVAQSSNVNAGSSPHIARDGLAWSNDNPRRPENTPNLA